eukprot:c22113_g1_i1 orf=661-1896(-)
MFSDPTSPVDSFRAPQWTPVVQGGTVADFIAAGSDSTIKTSMLPENELQNLPYMMSAQTSLSGQSSMFQRNLSGGYSFMAKPVDLISGHSLSRQASDGHISAHNSSSCRMPSLEGRPFPHMLGSGGEYAQRVVGGGTDWWSMKTFSDLVASSRGESLGFTNASRSELNGDVIQESLDPSVLCSAERIILSDSTAASVNSVPLEAEAQHCGLCSRRLSQRSSWSPHRLVNSGDLAVVAVLFCGHLYHADCLDKATPDIHCHDPPCPQCDSRKRSGSKMQELSSVDTSKKLIGFTSQITARNKSSRVGVATDDSNFSGFSSRDLYMNGKPTLTIDSGKKGNSQPPQQGERGFLGKPLLKRQFSFRSKSSKELCFLNAGMKKLGSPAQILPENRSAAENLTKKGERQVRDHLMN